MVGSFQLTCPRMVALDPGYSLDDVALMGCALEPCRLGAWNISEYSAHTASVPGPVVALHESERKEVSPKSKRWENVRCDIGGDGGVEGLYDAAHFGDTRIIPVDHKFSTDWSEYPGKQWYGFLCDLALARHGWGVVVHAFGCTLHWDGGCEVSRLVALDGTVTGVLLRPL